MTELLIAPARNTGCRDLEGLSEVIDAAAAGQRSPVDDILDAIGPLAKPEPAQAEMDIPAPPPETRSLAETATAGQQNHRPQQTQHDGGEDPRQTGAVG